MRHTPLMRTSFSPYHRHRFPAEIIKRSDGVHRPLADVALSPPVS